ncbi:hypothetical protein OY671_011022, partial [Metschnikowia pulcherrima]
RPRPYRAQGQPRAPAPGQRGPGDARTPRRRLSGAPGGTGRAPGAARNGAPHGAPGPRTGPDAREGPVPPKPAGRHRGRGSAVHRGRRAGPAYGAEPDPGEGRRLDPRPPQPGAGGRGPLHPAPAPDRPRHHAELEMVLRRQ